MDKVNIILCTYNGEKYLSTQLDSLFAQTYKNITVYIRDDGSTDNTVNIIKEYQQKKVDGINIVFIQDNDGNQGYVKNFLKTIRCSGDADFYAFCDQDDYWLPEKIERAVSALNQLPSEKCLIYCSSYAVCDGAMNAKSDCHVPTPLNELSVGKALSLYDGGWFMGFACVLNRKLKQVGFDNYIQKMYSHDIWTQAVAAGFDGEMYYDEKIMTHFRRHDNTTSIAESDVTSSFFAIWKYRWQETFGNGDLFDRIKNGIESYSTAYSDKVISREDKDFLRRFAPSSCGKKHRFRKVFYPHRLKKSFFVEIAWRFAILMGKI